MIEGSDLLTVSEAAHVLRISTSLTYELIRQERLPHLHLGRRVVIPADALRRWVEDASTRPVLGDSRDGWSLAP